MPDKGKKRKVGGKYWKKACFIVSLVLDYVLAILCCDHCVVFACLDILNVRQYVSGIRQANALYSQKTLRQNYLQVDKIKL